MSPDLSGVPICHRDSPSYRLEPTHRAPVPFKIPYLELSRYSIYTPARSCERDRSRPCLLNGSTDKYDVPDLDIQWSLYLSARSLTLDRQLTAWRPCNWFTNLIYTPPVKISDP